MSDTARPSWLTRHLDRLPAEVEPAHDLWPGIAARLVRPRRDWRVPAMAASLLLSVGLALFAWQALRITQAERVAIETTSTATATELMSPYLRIEAEHAMRWRTVRAALHPDLAVELQKDMDTLSRARSTLSTALAAAPADPGLHDLLRQVVVREAELIETGARLGGYAI
jgi:hypothetical protein